MKLLKHTLLNFNISRPLAVLFVFFILLGAAKATILTVTTANDSGAGSLRQTIVSSTSGDIIYFTNTLSGATIVPTSGELLLDKNLTIDASSLTSQIKLNGNHASRIFNVSNGANVTLNSLVITNGYAGTGNWGGAINNEGTLAMDNCTLTGNFTDSSANGGAIANFGLLTLTGCTLSGNSAGSAGAINNYGFPCTLRNCTVSGNVCANNGGAVDNVFGAILSIVHCTVSGNTAGGAGGGIDNYLSQVNLTNSIVAGNISQDIYNWEGSTNTAGGSNIVQSLGNAGALIGGSSILTGNPLLAPLGNYGGPTQTMPPLPGSPAIDAGGSGILNTDQRGYARPFGANPDIGAIEVTSPTNSPFGNTLIFNGVNQYVSVPNFGAIIPTNEITVEFWAYTTVAAGQSAFILNPDHSNNRFNVHINYGGPAPDVGVTYWDFGDITGSGYLGPVSAPANSISNWVHYAFVASQSGNYMSIYTNGTLCASKFGMTPFVRGNYELRIGAGNYNGRLDEFRIWNIARSQAQILANLNTPLTGNETNLLLYYRFDDNGGNPAANSAIAIGAAYNGTIVNNPILLNADEPFSTGGSAGSLAYTFTTLAGLSTSGSSDGVGNDARFSGPTGVAVDTNRNVYVADTLNHTIRKITPAGVVTTIAGLAGSAGYVEGSRENARFNHPGGVAVDNYGNVYVGDYYNRAIRKIATNGVVSTLAYAYQIPTYYFANQYLAVNGTGTTIYSEDGYSIIKLTLTGTNWVKTTLAGNAGIQAFADGTGANARFLNPAGLTVDQAGNVYVSDTSATPPNPTSYIRKITPSGVVTTIAGGGDGINLNGDGMGTNARINYPIGIAVDQFTNLYVGDGSAEIIRKITPVGTNWAVSTFAGRYNITGTITSSYSGVGTNAQFGFLLGMAVDGSGNIYAVDTAFNNVNKITSAGLVSAIAGPGDTPGFRDGTGSQARFNYPSSITLDSSGNLYVADRLNHVVRKISSVGQVITLAGQPGVAGEQDGVGNLALFSGPRGVVCDHSGNLFVTDSTSNKIRKITPAGEVTTIAGSGSAGYLDGSGTNAHFSYPAGIAIDNAGNLFVADEDNDVIRMIAPDGTVSTVAGSPIPHTGDFFFEGIYFNNGVPDGGYRDGIGTSALFNHPSGIAVDSAGNLYVADTGNIVIRKISPLQTPIVAGAANWVVTTLAGVAGVNGADDGTGEDATFGWAFPNLTTPGVTGITVDSSGNLYVTDDSNNTIRKITPAGVVTTLAGLPGILNFGGTDGTGEDARFSAPYAITVDSAGTLYVVDELNNTIRKGTFTQFGAANFTPFVPPAMNSQLRVTMLPSEASGQWRFPWEVAWRNSGQMASNLVAGNYVVEFRTVSGWLAIPASLTVVVTNNVSITNQYYPTLTTVDTNSGGSLTITLGLNPPPGAGWRFLGDTTSFYPSGYTTNLVAGTYLIEFAAVSGRTKPANASVQILPGQPTYLAENYLLAQSAPGGALLPFPVPVNQINDVNNYPFGFNGQLQSDTGYGSGVAVAANVVLTAAHVVFNDQTKSYVNQVYWYFQREAGVNEPKPLLVHSIYMLSGYASQRTNDLQIYAPDQSTPQSRNLDVAALYFDSPVAGGGYGGYLPSDAVPNPWLTGSSLKMLVGYPVDGSEFGNAAIAPGQMYQIDSQPYSFSLATDPVADQQVYTANWFLGYPGNSGGPVYAQLNGYYYPAGVYLGTLYNGITPYASAVRAIDSNVVNLITLAATQGSTGTNHTGGGVITIVPNQAISALNPGYVQFKLAPPAAVAAGAGWKLSGDAAYSSASNYTRAVLSTNTFSVQFKPIAGWNLPTNQAVIVSPGVLITNTAFYSVTNPLLVGDGASGLGITGTTGTVYRLERRTSLASGSWLPVSTNTIISNGFNLLLPKPATNGSVNFYRAVWLDQLP